MIRKVDKHFFLRLQKELGAPLHKELMNQASITAVRFSKQRFVQKNWVDKGMPKKWESRKRKDSGRVMVKSGRLKRSIRVVHQRTMSVLIGTDVPYAQIHNEGGIIQERVSVKSHSRKRSERQRKGSGDIKVKAHTRMMNTRIPPRQFLGSSQALANKIEKKMQILINKKLNNTR